MLDLNWDYPFEVTFEKANRGIEKLILDPKEFMIEDNWIRICFKGSPQTLHIIPLARVYSIVQIQIPSKPKENIK